MKKFGKFLFSLTAAAAAGAGLYYAYKKLTEQSDSDVEDDFEDDLDEFELDDDETPKAPEYVSINKLHDAAEDVAEKAAEKISDAVQEIKDSVTE